MGPKVHPTTKVHPNFVASAPEVHPNKGEAGMAKRKCPVQLPEQGI